MSADVVVSGVATRLGVDSRALRAVLLVECGSDDPARWLSASGRPTIRVEARHVLRAWTGAPGVSGLRVRDQHAGYWYGGRTPEPSRTHDASGRLVDDEEVCIDGGWSAYHGRQERDDQGRPGEWDALDCEDSLVGLDIATRCASWGPGQVLGDWRALGYSSVAELRSSAATPDGGLDLVARYLEAHRAALVALAAHDWAGFARAYNGPGQVDYYAGKLAAAFVHT